MSDISSTFMTPPAPYNLRLFTNTFCTVLIGKTIFMFYHISYFIAYFTVSHYRQKILKANRFAVKVFGSYSKYFLQYVFYSDRYVFTDFLYSKIIKSEQCSQKWYFVGWQFNSKFLQFFFIIKLGVRVYVSTF